MKLIEPAKPALQPIELGDIIVLMGEPYLLMELNGSYTCRGLDGISSLNGIYSTKKELIESCESTIANYKAVHYSEREYGLNIVKLDGGNKQ